MTQLIFYTPTILPKACLFTMGVSVKERENPIGFFGTGLKYAIATVLRLGGSITIETDDTKYIFNTESEDVRGKAFQMIDCRMYRGLLHTTQRMPMTTDYGKTWEPWMALRELYSNTIDEGGAIYEDWELESECTRAPGTYITVNCDTITDMWDGNARSTWLLDTRRRKPVWSCAQLEVYNKPSDSLFYQGIRVSSDGFKSALTYNIKKNVKLTEDRTYDSYNFQWMFSKYLMKMDVRDTVVKLLEATGNTEYMEHGLELNRIHIAGEASMVFQEEALRLYKQNANGLSYHVRDSVAQYMRAHHYDETYTIARLDGEQTKRANECVQFLSDKGFALHKYRVRWVEPIDGVMGQADPHTNTILLDHTLLQRETWMSDACTTLIEEYIHLEYGVNDYSRPFQNATLDIIFSLMLKGKVVKKNTLLDGLININKEV